MEKRKILPLPSSQESVDIPAELPLFMDYRVRSQIMKKENDQHFDEQMFPRLDNRQA
jgi:hypothetical protein